MFLAMASVAAPSAAQASPNEAQVKAAFLYNFLKFVEWPDSVLWGARDSLIVGIVGGGPTADAAATLLAGKSVNGRGIAIRRLGVDDTFLGVHALFIGKSDTTRTRRALGAVSALAILSIGESADFAERGGVIGLRVEANKIRFDINTRAATTAGLHISSKLLALARIVDVASVNRGIQQ